MKHIITLLVLFGLGGCVSSNGHYYILSVAPQPSLTYENKGRVIGVEKVTVPGYLYKREIAVSKTSSQIVLLDNALWGEDLDTGLTARLIGFLQKKFNQPNVYAYPWNLDRQPTLKVSLHIARFIAQGNSVYLDASWEIENIRTHKRQSKLFSTKVPTSSDASSIVSAMDSAFRELENAVAKGVKSFM